MGISFQWEMGPICLIFCHCSLAGGYTAIHLEQPDLNAPPCQHGLYADMVSLAKLSGDENQFSPHLVLAHIHFFIWITCFYAVKTQQFRWRKGKCLVSLGSSVSLSSEDVQELQFLSRVVFHKSMCTGTSQSFGK